MTSFKNQHYVPKFYLKNFSSDDVGLFIYDIQTRETRRRNIDRICSSFYFYADNQAGPSFETMLSKLEKIHSDIIKKLVNSKRISSLTPSDLQYLHNFILLQKTRTRASKMQTERQMNSLFDALKPYFAEDERAKEKNLTLEVFKSVRIVLNKANSSGMLLAMVGAALISDLNMKLLINKTDKPFIASDSPVVLYNYLRLERHGVRGLQSPGLVIFFPLNASIMLILFDPKAYRMGDEKNETVKISRSADIDEINRLQLLSAEDLVFFSSANLHDYVNALFESVEDYRGKETMNVEIIKKIRSKTNGLDLIHSSSGGCRYEIHISCIKVNQKYLNAIAQLYDENKDKPVTVVRNPEICRNVQKMSDDAYAKGKEEYRAQGYR